MLRMRETWVAVWLLTCSLPLLAQTDMPLTLPRGARIGVTNLLDPEVTHYHLARAAQDSFMKTHYIHWPVDAMLADALKPRLADGGLVLIPLGVDDTLARNLQDCLLEANLSKGLPKKCATSFAQIATREGVDTLIVLAPGLNNAEHAGRTRRKDLPEYLRGWGVVTDAGAAEAKPSLFNLTELLVIAMSADGPSLRGREWGGSYTLDWTDFSPPPDLKALPRQLLDQLQPLFSQLLVTQSIGLLQQVAQGP